MATERRPKADLLPVVRSLAASGLNLVSISKALAIPLRTLQRWAKDQHEAGEHWAKEPSPGRFARGPNALAAAPPDTAAPYEATTVLAGLRARLAHLAGQTPPAGEGYNHDRAIYELTRAINAVRAETDDPALTLTAIEAFARWAARTNRLDATAREAIHYFLEHLRAEATGRADPHDREEPPDGPHL